MFLMSLPFYYSFLKFDYVENICNYTELLQHYEKYLLKFLDFKLSNEKKLEEELKVLNELKGFRIPNEYKIIAIKDHYPDFYYKKL